MHDDAPSISSGSTCTITVPCFNEAFRFRPEPFTSFLASDDKVNFIFVNDGSTDNTLDRLREFESHHPGRVQVLDLGINKGKAEAVRSGMQLAIKRAGCLYTGFWDADLATPLEAVSQLLNILTDHPKIEMVFGSRVRLLGHNIHRKSSRHYLGRCFATVVSNVLQLPIYDTQCGAKLFRVTPEFETIVANPFQSRWIFDVEIIARFLALHNKDTKYLCDVIYESPLPSWRDVEGSKVTSADFFKAIGELIQIRNRYLR